MVRQITKQDLRNKIKKLPNTSVLTFVAKQLDVKPTEFIVKNIFSMLANAVKNGALKTADIASSLKNFGDKNKADDTGIDWNSVTIDDSTVKYRFLLSKDTMKVLKVDSENVGKVIQDAEQEAKTLDDNLRKRIKQKGVNVSEDELKNDTALIVNTVEGKGQEKKSGKELTQEIKQKKEKIKKIVEKKVKEQKEIANSIRSSKGKKQKPDNSNGFGELEKKIRSEILQKVNGNYKRRFKFGIYETQSFKKNLLKRLNKTLNKIDQPNIVAASINFKPEDAQNVVSEVKESKSGYKVRIIKRNDDDQYLNKIKDLIRKTIISNVEKQKLGKVSYSYYKYWNGDNPEGKSNTIFVFFGYNGDVKQVNEEVLSEEETISAKQLNAVSKIWDTTMKSVGLGKLGVDDAAKIMTPEQLEKYKEYISAIEPSEYGGDTFVSFNPQNSNGIDRSTFDSLKKMFWDDNGAFRKANHIAMRYATQNGKGNAVINGVVKKALDFAKSTGKLDDVVDTAKEVAKDTAKDAAEQVTTDTVAGLSQGERDRNLMFIGKNFASQFRHGESAKFLNRKDQLLLNHYVMEKFYIYQKGSEPPITINGQKFNGLVDAYQKLGENNRGVMFFQNEETKGRIVGLKLLKQLIKEDPEGNKSKIDALKLYLIPGTDLNHPDESVLSRIDRELKFEEEVHKELSESLGINPNTTTAQEIAKDTGTNSENTDLQNQNQEVPEEAKKKTSLFKSGTLLGWLRVGAKVTGYVLNQGKGFIDKLGGIKIKNEEDKDLYAEARFLIQNENSDKDYSDSQFSVRYSLTDNKWHATNIDDRKMKIDENKLIEIFKKTNSWKEFHDTCVNRLDAVHNDQNALFMIYSTNMIRNSGVDPEITGDMSKIVTDYDEIKRSL